MALDGQISYGILGEIRSLFSLKVSFKVLQILLNYRNIWVAQSPLKNSIYFF